MHMFADSYNLQSSEKEWTSQTLQNLLGLNSALCWVKMTWNFTAAAAAAAAASRFSRVRLCVTP